MHKLHKAYSTLIQYQTGRVLHLNDNSGGNLNQKNSIEWINFGRNETGDTDASFRTTDSREDTLYKSRKLYVKRRVAVNQ